MTPSSSNGPAITATDASTETSASPSSATARPLRSPTTGANPPPRPNGADHSPVASTCPPMVFGKTHTIFRTTSASEPAGACGGDRLRGEWGQFAAPHAVEHPFHRRDNLRAGRGESGLVGVAHFVRVDTGAAQHGVRVGQLTGQPGQRVG